MSGRPLVIAHRGASADAVDNSLDAFAKAIEVGSDMLEFDVRRTRDECLIAFHDRAVGGRPIGTLTRAEIEGMIGHLPPLLSEVLELAAGRLGLDIELKESGYVPTVLDAVRQHAAGTDVIVTSFLDAVVSEVKRLAPEIRAGLLLGVDRPDGYLRTRLSELYPVSRARACHADYVAPHVALIRLGAAKRAAAAGYRALVWTVNDAETIERLLRDSAVAGIITDVPARALELRDGPRGAGAQH